MTDEPIIATCIVIFSDGRYLKELCEKTFQNSVPEEGDYFEYNKDSGLFICPKGHMAIRRARTGKKNWHGNQIITLYFDVENIRFVLST